MITGLEEKNEQKEIRIFLPFPFPSKITVLQNIQIFPRDLANEITMSQEAARDAIVRLMNIYT